MSISFGGGVGGTIEVGELAVLVAKGDLLGHTGTAHVRHPVGTNGAVLTADSAEARGIKWAATAAATLAGVLAAGNTAGGTQIKGANGSAGAPGYAFEGDATAGWRLIAAGLLRLEEGGTGYLDVGRQGSSSLPLLRVLADHGLHLPSGGATFPSLRVSGGANLTSPHTGLFFPTGGTRLDDGLVELGVTIDDSEATRFTANFMRTSKGRRRRQTAVSTTYTAHRSDDIVYGDATGGAFTISLPPLSTHQGQVFVFQRINSGANAVTVDGDGAELINGAATQTLATQYAFIVVQATPSEWRIIG